jgi:hypothetical protein
MIALLLAIPCVFGEQTPASHPASLPAAQTAPATQPQDSVRGDRDLLRGIARQVTDNLARIRTWQGEVTITSHSNRRGQDFRSKSRVRFLYDALAPAEQSLRRVEAVIRTAGQEGVEERVYEDNGYIKDDVYYLVSIIPGTSRQLVLKDFRKARPSIRSEHFSALWYMTCEGQSIPEMLDRCLRPRVRRSGSYFQTAEEQGLVKLEFVRNDKPVQHYLFDPAQGGCLVENWGDDGWVMARYRCTYQQVSGAWIPKTVDYEYKSVRERDGTETKHLEWTNQKINEPLPQGAFAWEALGLQPGDLVSDAINQTAYEYSPDGISRNPLRIATTRQTSTQPTAEPASDPR